MNRINVSRVGDTVVMAIDIQVAEKLMATLSSITDATGEPWDLNRLMNHIANTGVHAGVYHGTGEMTVRVHPMFKEKK